jgi:hypothetical protein
MSSTADDTGDGDHVSEHARKTYEAMELIKHQTAILIKQVDAMSAAIGPSPSNREASGDEVAASGAADKPPSVSGTEPRPASMNAHNIDRDQVVNECVVKVMDKIQPLLKSLEKIRTEQSVPRQLTEEEHIAKMCDEMGQRIARRRGFVPAMARSANLERNK